MINIPNPVIVPRFIVKDNRLTSNELVIYVKLLEQCYGNSTKLEAGYSDIANLVGLSRITVIKSLTRLKELGYVSIQEQFNEHGGRTRNIYELLMPMSAIDYLKEENLI